MTLHFHRDLLIPEHLFGIAAAYGRERPGRSVLITVDENIVDGVRAEYRARAVTPDSAGGAALPAPAHSFVMQWHDNPPEALARALKRVFEVGYAGVAFLPLPGSSKHGRGFVRCAAGGVKWLDFVIVVGPGMRVLPTSTLAEDPGGSAMLAGRISSSCASP